MATLLYKFMQIGGNVSYSNSLLNFGLLLSIHELKESMKPQHLCSSARFRQSWLISLFWIHRKQPTTPNALYPLTECILYLKYNVWARCGWKGVFPRCVERGFVICCKTNQYVSTFGAYFEHNNWTVSTCRVCTNQRMRIFGGNLGRVK